MRLESSVANEPSHDFGSTSRAEPVFESERAEPSLHSSARGSIKRNEISMGVSAQEFRNYKMKNVDCETKRWFRDRYNWRIIQIITEIVRYIVDKNLQNWFIWSNLRIATHDDELIHDSENVKKVYIYYWQLKLWTKKELSLINKWKKTELRFKLPWSSRFTMLLNLLCDFRFFRFNHRNLNLKFYHHHLWHLFSIAWPWDHRIVFLYLMISS